MEPDISLLERVEKLSNSLNTGRVVALTGVARAVLRRGDIDSARQRIYALLTSLDKASSDSSPWERCRAAMLRELVISRPFQEVLSRIDSLENQWHQERLRQDIAMRLLGGGFVQDAVDVATAMAGYSRDQAIRDIALALVARGDDSRALQIVASSGIWEFEQGSIRAAMIDALLNAGEIDRASAIFEGAPADVYQTVPAYAAGLARLGHLDRALSVARGAKGDTAGRALAALAEATYRNGDRQAREIAQEALGVLEGRREMDRIDNAIRLQILSGHIEDAIASTRSIPSFNVKETMGGAVSLLVEFGELNHAIVLTEGIDDTYARADVREALVTSLVKNGEVERAVGFADGLGRFDKASAAKQIVRALVKKKESIDDAIRIASTITEDSTRAESLAECAVALLANGSVRRALDVLDLLDKVGEVIYRARAIEEVLQKGQVDPTTLQRLVAMSRSLDTEHRAGTLGAAAGTWRRLGNVGEALAMLDEALDAASRSEGERAVYESLQNGAQALSDLDGGTTMLSVYDAAVELDNWWP